MTTPIPATTRSPSAALQTHRAPRTRSAAAKPDVDTTATISPAARVALEAAGTGTTAPATTATHPTAAQKAYGRTPT